MPWIGFLLVLQLGAVYAFLAVHDQTGWGIAHASPPGLAILTQLVRVALLLVAARAWFGIVRDPPSIARQRLWLVACFLGLVLGSGAVRMSASLGLFILFQRMKWFESLTGWRRVVGLVISVSLLLALSFVPVATIVAGRSEILFELTPTPPPLLVGGVAARTELILARPLDRIIQAIVDVFRVQLLVLAIKFLFLPIRLSGMSLKRRFWVNYVLVRSIPSVLSWVVVAVILYLALGYTRAGRVRGELDQTLARAATAANALGDASFLAHGADPSRLDLAHRWMAPDGDSAHIVVRGPDSTVHASGGTPGAILVPALSLEDTSVTRGLYPRGDGLYLTVVRRSAPGTIEVWIPIDSTYLARVMRRVGGSARLKADPHLFLGNRRMRIDADTSWTEQAVIAQYTEPRSTAGGGRPWFLSRLYLPSGDWAKSHFDEWRGGMELYLESTPRSLFWRTVLSIGDLYSYLFLLFILGMTLGMIEGFAVRSGKSIVNAVLEEVGTLRKAADEFGAGRLDYRIPVKGNDEISIVATSFNDMAANLERQRKELIAAERFEEDLAVARAIQQRFLPQQSPVLPGLDVAGVSIPSKEVGGDLFYWFPHDDGTLGFVLGDVSGKSVPAALVMSNVLAALRVQAIERVELSASLERTNRLMVDQIEPGRFVTLFYGEVDPTRSELRYVSAGHNPSLLVRANGDLEWLREGGVPLGVLPAATYRTASIDFALGDTLIVYSDGVTEAQGPERSAPAAGGEPVPELLGEERLASAARELRGRPASAVLQGVLDAVRRFAGGVEQADDVTIVVVRRA